MKVLDYLKECETCQVDQAVKQNLCHMCITQKIMKGKWIVVILWLLRDKTMRFSELKRSIPNVTQTYLSKQLKSLEADNLIVRKSYNQVPPKVEYYLSESGIKFIDVLDEMSHWGKGYAEEFIVPVIKSMQPQV